MRWWAGNSEETLTIIVLLDFLVCSTSTNPRRDTESKLRCNTTTAADLMLVILSQNTTAHTNQAYRLRDQILTQGPNHPHILIFPQDVSVAGGWTLLNLFPEVLRRSSVASLTWVLFCQDSTRLNLSLLLEILTEHDCSAWSWIGRPLRDRRRTARHHYAAPAALRYPFPGAGFAITMRLVERMSSKVVEQRSSFSIDPYYETAESIYLNTNVQLTYDVRFCLKYNLSCATAPTENRKCDHVPRKSLYFAIKTFRDNHSGRARIAKRTWIAHAPHYHFFSDLNDTLLPALNTGTPNTLIGHCHKTITILKLIRNMMSTDFGMKIKWIILTDDDTIVSVRRMEAALGCFANENGPIMIGERYGFGFGDNKKGYEFVTGGGGTALSAEAARALADCACAAHDAPDDMWLGACALRRGVTLIHHDGFHQGLPEEYAPEYLDWVPPVTFHGLDDAFSSGAADPRGTYERWFHGVDEENAPDDENPIVPWLRRPRRHVNISRDEL